MFDVNPLTDDFGYIIEGDSSVGIDRLELCEYMDLFKSSNGGALLFRGLGGDVETFKNFTEKHGIEFRTSYTNVSDRLYPDGDTTLATVNSGKYAINFHNELTIPYTADVFWMYCIKPAEDRGRTGIVDGAKVFDELTAESKKFLEKEGAMWTFSDIPDSKWRGIFPITITEDIETYFGQIPEITNFSIGENNELSFRYYQSPIHISKFCDKKVFACGVLDFYDVITMRNGRHFPNTLIAELTQAIYKHALWIEWEPGDVLLVDNTRVMHAREAFEDTSRELLVRYSNLKEEVWQVGGSQ